VIVAGDERTGDDDLVGVCDVPRQGYAAPECKDVTTPVHIFGFIHVKT